MGAPLIPAKRLSGAARTALPVLLAAAGLAACATGGGVDLASTSPAPPASTPPPPMAGHGTNAPYQVAGRWYYPHAQPDYDEVGLASWYGARFHNHTTADGEVFDQDALSAAHTTLPLPSLVEVTNLANGRSLRVRLNDRGPFVDGRILDLSRAAAAELGFEREGVARVRVRYIGPAPPLASGVMLAEARPRAPAPAGDAPVFAPPAETAPVGTAPVETAYVEPIPYARAVQDPRQAAPAARYTVQVAVFHTRDAAERAAASLSDAGRTSIETVTAPDGVIYRLMMIGFPDEDSAAVAWVRAHDAGYTGARVVGPG